MVMILWNRLHIKRLVRGGGGGMPIQATGAVPTRLRPGHIHASSTEHRGTFHNVCVGVKMDPGQHDRDVQGKLGGMWFPGYLLHNMTH